MGLFGRVLGGALEGLGTGITREADRKNQLEGERLRNSYLMARQKDQQEFAAGQAQLGREHSATQADLSREHASTEAELNRDLTRDQMEQTGDFREQDIAIKRDQLELTETHYANQMKRWEMLDEMQRGKIAHELALMKEENELLKEQVRQGPKVSVGDDLKIQEFSDKIAVKMVEDEEGNMVVERDLDGRPVVDRELSGWISQYYKDNTQWPWEVAVKPIDFLQTMRTHKLSIEGTLELLRKRKFRVSNPSRLINSHEVRSYVEQSTGAVPGLGADAPVQRTTPARPAIPPRKQPLFGASVSLE